MRMRRIILLLCLFHTCGICAQDLAPRAYVITPLHSNAVTLTYSFYNGEIILMETCRSRTLPLASTYLCLAPTTRSTSSAAPLASSLRCPMVLEISMGPSLAREILAHRSGLLPVTLRFSVNLIGGPSMSVEEFRKWRQRNILGISFKFVPPTGQYDPTKLINYGTNRWAFKPEVGYSRRWGHWIVDTYGAAWFFTTNSEFFSRNQFSPGINTQSETPIGAFEGHLSYDFKPRLWVFCGWQLLVWWHDRCEWAYQTQVPFSGIHASA